MKNAVGGAFYATTELVNGSTGEGGDNKVIFDASRCNSIYGSSVTVQPASLTVRHYIKF